MIGVIFAALVSLAAAAPSPAPAVVTFHDPAMAFIPPAGYVAQTPFPHYDPADLPNPTVVAAYVKNPGKPNVHSITIAMESFDGSLDQFKTYSSNELREQQGSAFVRDRGITTLSNGMPADFREVTIGDGFQELKMYEYVWIDGVRGIVLSITARYGEISEEEAKAALAGASAVAFPRNRF